MKEGLWPICRRVRVSLLIQISAYLPVHQGVSFVKKKFSVLVEKDEDGYLVATVPTLPGCHTQARSMDDLLERVKEAIEAYLEAEKDVDISEFVGVQVVEAEAG